VARAPGHPDVGVVGKRQTVAMIKRASGLIVPEDYAGPPCDSDEPAVSFRRIASKPWQRT
jgi:hypothetical protein